jgi:DNA-binding response OmpR family regulator
MSAASSEMAHRVLIVEDEMLIALMLQDMVAEAGLAVAAIANTLQAGVELAGREDVQLAILDINLNGEEAYPVAEILRARRIPFIFSTGYPGANVRPEYQAVPRLIKPYQQDMLIAAIAAAGAGRPDASR